MMRARGGVTVMMMRICRRRRRGGRLRIGLRMFLSIFCLSPETHPLPNHQTNTPHSQRAFRERKERHVKDLEAKLAALEANTNTISAENSRLKLQLQKASTENEILKATSHMPSPSPPSTGPMRFSPTDFYSEVLHAHADKTPSHRIVTGENGARMLAAGATWDFIIKHPLYKRGMVDVGDVSERLKKVAKCDGQGPVFEEGAVLEAIERSVASGSDELL